MADDLLLVEWHLLHRNLHPQVSAGDHYCIGCLNDLLQILKRFALLDLGHDSGTMLLAGLLLDQEAQFLHIRGTSHE